MRKETCMLPWVLRRIAGTDNRWTDRLWFLSLSCSVFLVCFIIICTWPGKWWSLYWTVNQTVFLLVLCQLPITLWYQWCCSGTWIIFSCLCACIPWDMTHLIDFKACWILMQPLRILVLPIASLTHIIISQRAGCLDTCGEVGGENGERRGGSYHSQKQPWEFPSVPLEIQLHAEGETKLRRTHNEEEILWLVTVTWLFATHFCTQVILLSFLCAWLMPFYLNGKGKGLEIIPLASCIWPNTMVVRVL